MKNDHDSLLDLDRIIGEVMRVVFQSMYKRTFGRSANQDVCARLATAATDEIIDWLPNFLGAKNDEDLFISSLEYDYAQRAAFLAEIKFGIKLGVVHSLRDVQEALELHSSIDKV